MLSRSCLPAARQALTGGSAVPTTAGAVHHEDVLAGHLLGDAWLVEVEHAVLAAQSAGYRFDAGLVSSGDRHLNYPRNAL